MSSSRLLFACALSSLLATTVLAQPRPNPKTAFTNPADAGPDFLVQGEYVGSLKSGNDARQHGLQVIARGDGAFDAVLFEGGLPGAGAVRESKQQLTGRTNDKHVTELASAAWKVSIANDVATVVDSTGAVLGTLMKTTRISPTMGLEPPAGAIILFNGSSTENLDGAKVTPDGLLEKGFMTKAPVGPFRAHIEFRSPFMPYATGQARGNSGVYIQRRYEVQILDSFGLDGAFNECGALYRQQVPDVNMCLSPLSWQTYDIFFQPPTFNEAGEKQANAVITVFHNGVAIHDQREIKSKTGAGRPEEPHEMPILFQDHGDPVNFRNMWIVLGDPHVAAADNAAFVAGEEVGAALAACCETRCSERRCCRRARCRRFLLRRRCR